MQKDDSSNLVANADDVQPITENRIAFVIRHKDEPLNLLKTIRSMVDGGWKPKLDQLIIADDGSSRDTWRILLEAMRPGSLIGKLREECGDSHVIITTTINADWLMNAAGIAELNEIAIPVVLRSDRKINGPQATADRGFREVDIKRCQTVAFCDAHLSFMKGWRETIDPTRVPGSHARLWGGWWHSVPSDSWEFSKRSRSFAGTAWQWNRLGIPDQFGKRSRSFFNFGHVEPLPGHGKVSAAVPMAGCVFFPSDLFFRIRGFQGMPYNHGMEFILAAKALAAGGLPPLTMSCVGIGHVDQINRRPPMDNFIEGMMNGAMLIRYLSGEDPTAADQWIETLPESVVKDAVRNQWKHHQSIFPPGVAVNRFGVDEVSRNLAVDAPWKTDPETRTIKVR